MEAPKCRKCGEQSVGSRRSWDNEAVWFIYQHDGGKECRVRCTPLDAEAWAAEDRGATLFRPAKPQPVYTGGELK